MIPDLVTLSLFLATVAVFVITPGPNMIFCVSRAIVSGPGAGIASAVGVCAGLVIHASAAGLGLSKLFQYFPLAYDALRLFGAGYLLWLAWQTLRGGGLPAATGVSAGPELKDLNIGRFMVQGFINALLSPKAVFFYLVLFPQFLDPQQGNLLVQSLVLITIINVMNFTVIGSLCLCAGKAARWLAAHPGVLAWQRRCVAGVFAALALKVLFDRRAQAGV